MEVGEVDPTGSDWPNECLGLDDSPATRTTRPGGSAGWSRCRLGGGHAQKKPAHFASAPGIFFSSERSSGPQDLARTPLGGK